jgi:hypothetical protein
MRYAVIDNGIVSNIIILDDITQWVFPSQIVAILNGEVCDIGYSYDENANPRFVAPVEPPQE